LQGHGGLTPASTGSRTSSPRRATRTSETSGWRASRSATGPTTASPSSRSARRRCASGGHPAAGLDVPRGDLRPHGQDEGRGRGAGAQPLDSLRRMKKLGIRPPEPAEDGSA